MLTWIKKQKWRSHLSSVIVFLVVATGITWYQQRDMASQHALPLQTHSVQGQHLNLAALTKDKPVMLYFWGSWCGICDITSPWVDTLSQKNSDYEIITIALKSGNNSEVTSYLNQQGYTFKTINDPNGYISQQWGVNVTPSIAYIFPGGEISSLSTGLTSKWGMQLRLWWAGF